MGTRLVVAGLLGALVSAGAVAAAAPSCLPVAQLSGEPLLVGPIRAILHVRGISSTGKSACGSVRALVDRADKRVRVTLADADGRRIDRFAEDPEGAATIIESWARRDVSAPLLAARSAPSRAPPVATAARQAEPHSRRLELGAAGEAGLTSDGALWTGVRAGGCLRFGGWCVGPQVRYLRDTERRGDSASLATTRWGLDLLLTADRPFTRGRFTVWPGAGVGQTSVHVTRDTEGDEDAETAMGLHLDAHLGAALRLVGAWSLRLDLAGQHSPFLPTVYDDPADREPPLAGAPRSRGWLGLGLTYGGL